MITDKERAQRSQDQKWNMALLANHPDLSAYATLASQRRAFVYRDTALVVWEIIDGALVVKKRLTVVNIYASAHDGFSVYLRDEALAETMTIGHLPTRIPHTQCFFWVPRHADARHLPANHAHPESSYRFTLSVMLGSPGHPERRCEGVEYLTYARDLPLITSQLAEVANA